MDEDEAKRKSMVNAAKRVQRGALFSNMRRNMQVKVRCAWYWVKRVGRDWPAVRNAALLTALILPVSTLLAMAVGSLMSLAPFCWSSKHKQSSPKSILKVNPQRHPEPHQLSDGVIEFWNKQSLLNLNCIGK